MRVIVVGAVLLVAITAVAEILGCYLPWLVLKQGRTPWLLKLKPEAVIVGDSTRQVYAGNLFFAAAGPVRWFNASVGFGALGFGLPAPIGASLAAPERPVVCLAGDGGLQFTLAELGTAVEAGARLIVILLNNRGYGEIRSTMLARHIEPVGVDLHTPDFQAIAGAYGWASERLTGAEALPDLLRSAAARTLPTLIEIQAG